MPDRKDGLILTSIIASAIALSLLRATRKTKNNKQGTIGERLARPNILTLLPYRCARDDYETGTLLDANENSLGPTQPSSFSNHLQLERYPSPYQWELKSLVADLRGVKKEQVFVGVGSDEAIDMLFRIFCVPGVDNVITTPPTYGMYKVCANVNDVAIKKVPLTPSFDLRIPEMLSACDSKTKMIFVCSPGNPTSKSVPPADVIKLATSFPGLVIVDEAYVDFSTHGSMSNLISKHENIVVLQTLSKAFGLAGIRCGFALGDESVVGLMNNVKAPYNLNSLTSERAVEALKSMDVLKGNMEKILKERDRVSSVLSTLPFVVRVFPSDSNFLLFQLTSSAKSVYQIMADTFKVVARYRGTEIHCNECIRVTIGKREENDVFLKALEGAWEEVKGGEI
mmetsp:Transcript_21358/g.44466  ORF Transcript_21358/g.44466 Transcript_21358/m.44466 type:complete len:397 (-) Transcript_21358:69-1259(-)